MSAGHSMRTLRDRGDSTPSDRARFPLGVKGAAPCDLGVEADIAFGVDGAGAAITTAGGGVSSRAFGVFAPANIALETVVGAAFDTTMMGLGAGIGMAWLAPATTCLLDVADGIALFAAAADDTSVGCVSAEADGIVRGNEKN